VDNPESLAALVRRFRALHLRHRGYRYLLVRQRHDLTRNWERMWATREYLRLELEATRRRIQAVRELLR
jgi:hypothetical protein